MGPSRGPRQPSCGGCGRVPGRARCRPTRWGKGCRRVGRATSGPAPPQAGRPGGLRGCRRRRRLWGARRRALCSAPCRRRARAAAGSAAEESATALESGAGRNRRCRRRWMGSPRLASSAAGRCSGRNLQRFFGLPQGLGVLADARPRNHVDGGGRGAACRGASAHRMCICCPAMTEKDRKIMIVLGVRISRIRALDLFLERACGTIPGPSVPNVSNRFGAHVIFAGKVDARCGEAIGGFQGGLVLKYLDDLLFGKDCTRSAFSLFVRWIFVQSK
jgi:hypothetical protein